MIASVCAAICCDMRSIWTASCCDMRSVWAASCCDMRSVWAASCCDMRSVWAVSAFTYAARKIAIDQSIAIDPSIQWHYHGTSSLLFGGENSILHTPNSGAQQLDRAWESAVDDHGEGGT